MHRSGQVLFLPHAMLRQREKASADHVVSPMADICMLIHQNKCI